MCYTGQRGLRCCQHLPRYGLHGAHFTPQRYLCPLIARSHEIKTGALALSIDTGQGTHPGQNSTCTQKSKLSWKLGIPWGTIHLNSPPDPWFSKAQGFFQLTVTNCAGKFLMSTLQKLESFLKREPQSRKYPHLTGLWANLWCIFLCTGGPSCYKQAG